MNGAAGNLPDLREQGVLVQRVQAYLRWRLQPDSAPDSVLLQAWDEFERIYSRFLRGLARHCHLGPEEIDEVVQDVWLTVIRILPECHWEDNRAGFRAWLGKVLHSKAVDMRRRQGRHPAQALEQACAAGEEPFAWDGGTGCFVERQRDGEEVQALLPRLRHQLSARGFSILQMRYLEEQSEGDVAAALGMRPRAVRYALYRALKKARAVFGAVGVVRQ